MLTTCEAAETKQRRLQRRRLVGGHEEVVLWYQPMDGIDGLVDGLGRRRRESEGWGRARKCAVAKRGECVSSPDGEGEREGIGSKRLDDGRRAGSMS